MYIRKTPALAASSYVLDPLGEELAQLVREHGVEDEAVRLEGVNRERIRRLL